MPRPPHAPRPPAHPLHGHIPLSDIHAFIRRADIDALLHPLVPDDGERALVLRALLDVGPAHHRGANYILLRLLGLLLERSSRSPSPPAEAEAIPIPLRLPPHLATDRADAQFPLRLPTRALERLAPRGSRDFAAMVDCLIDGPPQHSLANAAILSLLEALLSGAEADT
ncbi:MAG: hypothetical protein U1A78_30110 [Polyangia bacterium]